VQHNRKATDKTRTEIITMWHCLYKCPY